MVSIADPVKPRKQRTHTCALCGKKVDPDLAVYSRWTHDRYHPLCIWRRK